MRRCGSAKQCLWLGPSGYLGGGRRRLANPDAYSYGDANCNNNAECNAHSYTYGNDHALTHSCAKSNTQTSAEPASSAVRIG